MKILPKKAKNIMKTISRMLLILVIVLCASVYGYGQVFVERLPDPPRYERTQAPSPRHVWIDQDWQTRDGKYEFSGGRWAEPPLPGEKWIPGHWKEKRRGWVWIPGHWR